MDILKLYRSHSYVTYSNYNRVISDSNNLNLVLKKLSIYSIYIYKCFLNRKMNSIIYNMGCGSVL